MTSGARFERCTPILRVENDDRAIAYYAGIGFEEDWRHQYEESFPVFASISRDGVQLFLSEHGGDGVFGVHLFVNVRCVDLFHAECIDAKVAVLEPPADMPFGVRQMSLKDVDGNILVIGEPISAERAEAASSI